MLSDAAAQQAQVDLDQTNYDRDAMLLRSGTVSASHLRSGALRAAKTTRTSSNPCASRRKCSSPSSAAIRIFAVDAASAISAGAGAGRRSATPARSHGRQGAVRRHCHQRALHRARQISRGFDDRFLSRRYRSRLGRRQSERNRTDLCAARPAGHGDGRHLSGRGVARHRRERQPGGGAGIFAAAGAEHQRQLGQGRAARADARARRHQRQEPAAAARRHERRGRRRYRPCARASRTS